MTTTTPDYPGWRDSLNDDDKARVLGEAEAGEFSTETHHQANHRFGFTFFKKQQQGVHSVVSGWRNRDVVEFVLNQSN